MTKVKIIVNPSSGKEESVSKINELIALMSKDGYRIDLCFTTKAGDAQKFASEDDGENYIIVAGGDGTLNEVVNGIYKSKRETPLAVFQGGTVNDFASALKIPVKVEEFYQMLKRKHTIKADLGLAGDKVFANVAAGGMFTDIAYQVEDDKKTTFGRFAYYAEGLKEFSKIGTSQKHYFSATFKCDKMESKEDTILFIIANSASVGGFKNIVPNAQIHDGYLDVLIIKAMEKTDIPKLLTSFVNSNHFNHEKVIYLRTKELQIESDSEIIVDVDGEKAGVLPMNFKVLEKAINLIVK